MAVKGSVLKAMAAARRTRDTLGKGRSLEVWDLAEALKNFSDTTMTRLPDHKPKLKAKESAAYVSRFAMLEINESIPFTFKRSTHVLAVITGYNKKSGLFVLQPFNHSGEKEGRPQEEAAEDVWVFPPENSEVKIDTGDDEWYQISQFDIPCMSVKLTPKKAPKAAKPKRGQTAKRKKQISKKGKAAAKRKKKSTRNKPLDKPASASTNSNTSEAADASENSKFNTFALLKSFENPRCLYFASCLLACLYVFVHASCLLD